MARAPSRALALAATSLGFGVVQLDVTVVNVAVAPIHADLGGSVAALQWVVNAYTVVFASLILLAGGLGDRVGAKRVLAGGFVLFTAASVACGLAPGTGTLVAARAVQGVGAAALVPASLSVLAHAHPGPADRARAVGVWAAGASVGLSGGPVLGGLLIAALGWRSVFWINTPVALLVIVGVVRYLPETKAPARTSLDWVGAVLLGATMTLLIFPLTEGRATGWPAWTWACLAAVPVAAAALVWWQRRMDRRGGLPLLPPELFGFRTVRIGLLVGLPVFITFGGFMFVYSILAGGHGLSPLRIGLSLLPMSLGFLGSSIASGRLAPRFGVNVLAAGAVLTALGFVWLGLVVDGFTATEAFTVWQVAAPMVVIGVGIALIWSPLMGVVLSQVHGSLAGLGGGLFLTVMQAGLGFGSAVVGSVYFGLAADHAFVWTVLILAAVMLVVAPFTRLLRPRT